MCFSARDKLTRDEVFDSDSHVLTGGVSVCAAVPLCGHPEAVDLISHCPLLFGEVRSILCIYTLFDLAEILKKFLWKFKHIYFMYFLLGYVAQQHYRVLIQFIFVKQGDRVIMTEKLIRPQYLLDNRNRTE